MVKVTNVPYLGCDHLPKQNFEMPFLEKQIRESEKKNNIKPLGSRILVMRSKPEQNKGSVLLLESTQKKENLGIVIAIGNDVKDIAINDHVLFMPYSGTPITIEDNENEYIIFKEEEILAIKNEI